MSEFVFTLMTNDPSLARTADAAGIERIGIDLETLGKNERQSATKHWITDHKIDDLPAVRKNLSRAGLFARSNPIHSDSKPEIEKLLQGGVKIIMLPYFKTPDEVRVFAEIVGDAAKKVILVETPEALDRIDEIVSVPTIDEVHFGLNDLHLALGLTNHFEVLSRSLLDDAIKLLRQIDRPFGIAGVGRVQQKSLPIATELIYAQLVRLGATRALISRSFLQSTKHMVDLGVEITSVRCVLKQLAHRQPEELDQLFEEFCGKVEMMCSAFHSHTNSKTAI